MPDESFNIKSLVQEAELYHLIDELKVGIFMFNSIGNTVWSNVHFQSIIGYSLEELASRNIFDLFVTEDAIRLLENEIHDSDTIQGVRRGTNQPLYLKLLSCKEKDGLGTILKIIDVTQQKLSHNQLTKTYKELEDFKYALDQSATVSITDANGDIVYVNDKFCEISKYDRSEIIGQNHRIVKSGYHPQEVFENLWDTISQGKVWRGEVCNKAKDGSIWWGGATIVPFLDENGKPYQYIGIRSDITDKKIMEEKIKRSNESIQLSENRFRSLVEHSYDLIILTDEKGIINYSSPNIDKITSRTADELIGKSVFDFVIEDDHDFVKKYLKDINNSLTTATVEIRTVNKKGNIRINEVIIVNLLDDPAVKAIKINLRDITEKKMAEKKIFEISNYDFLTKLPNHQLFKTFLKEELIRSKEIGRKFSVIILDFHGIRFVNDTLGSLIGDQLLQQAAKRLQDFIGEIGMVSRFGGVEFNILLPNIANHVIVKLAKDIIQLFEQPFLIQDYELFFTVSIGVSIFPDSGDSVASLLKNAHTAVHQANESGPNHYQIYSQNMDVKAYKTFTLNNDLRKAIKNNEFYTEFQPRVDLLSNKIVAAEALVRWKHPKWGIVSPKEFISLAERSGLIGPLGEMVLFNACQQLKEWQEKGLQPIKMSVNFSVLQFLQTDIVQVVKNVLERTNIEAKWLEIEITESVFMENEEMILMKISHLKEMGIGIAIDDFGTGYSSLGYLKKMKADLIKIDKSFINGIPNDPDSIDIVAAVIQLAKKLKIRVVAEGVESKAQLKFLKGLLCDEVQGYIYSKPLGIQEFTGLLKMGICFPVEQTELQAFAYENRREFFRILLKYPLSGEMTITLFGGKKVDMGSTKILILDIGPGGLKIETTVKLPIRSDMVLKFSTKILGGQLDLYGKVVWRKEIDEQNQTYGISFIISEEARKHLTSLLNHFQIKLQEKDVLSNCSFVTENKQYYFNYK